MCHSSTFWLSCYPPRGTLHVYPYSWNACHKSDKKSHHRDCRHFSNYLKAKTNALNHHFRQLCGTIYKWIRQSKVKQEETNTKQAKNLNRLLLILAITIVLRFIIYYYSCHISEYTIDHLWTKGREMTRSTTNVKHNSSYSKHTIWHKVC